MRRSGSSSTTRTQGGCRSVEVIVCGVEVGPRKVVAAGYMVLAIASLGARIIMTEFVNHWHTCNAP
ncbi:hypothetical protein C7T79_04350 [Xanthomonas oryzae pv. oryzicola]|nr:hypothetical protein C7T79_04350 [Xanthomonas oryzae pv. oryzicola]